MRFNNVEVNSDTICTIMINEVVLSCSKDDFYGKRNGAEEIGNKVAEHIM